MHIERVCHSETYYMDLGCNTRTKRERERESCINYIKRRNSVLIILDHTSKDIILTFFFFFLNVNNKKLVTSRFILR